MSRASKIVSVLVLLFASVPAGVPSMGPEGLRIGAAPAEAARFGGMRSFGFRGSRGMFRSRSFRRRSFGSRRSRFGSRRRGFRSSGRRSMFGGMGGFGGGLMGGMAGMLLGGMIGRMLFGGMGGLGGGVGGPGVVGWDIVDALRLDRVGGVGLGVLDAVEKLLVVCVFVAGGYHVGHLGSPG